MNPAMQELVAIPTFELRAETALPFDLFVRLPVTNRIILYRREGSAIEAEKVDKTGARKMGFFVQRGDYDKYLKYATEEFRRLLSRPAAEGHKKRDAAARMLSNAFSSPDVGEARELVTRLGDVVHQFVAEISQEGFLSRQNLFLKFATLAKSGTDFQRHPLNVASITVMLAVGLGIGDQRTLVEAGLAALLHDVGLTQLPVSVIAEAHKFNELGTVSKALLKLHPQGALDLCRKRGIQVSKLMAAMIGQHHEEYGGRGYPMGLVGEAVHPLAQVLHVADDLDDLLAREADPSEPESSLHFRLRALFAGYERESILDPALRKRLEALLL